MQEKEIEIAGGSLRYIIEEGRARVTGYGGLGAEAAVPERIDGCPVQMLEKKCFLGKRSLLGITVPDTVSEIGDFCFAGNRELREVSLPGGRVTFGKAPFKNCPNLKKIVVRGTSGGAEKVHGELMALAVEFDSPYLLDTAEAGSAEWYRKWDARLMSELETPDVEGHTNAVLCGEEDYESVNLEGFIRAKRILKARHCLVRLRFPEQLGEDFRHRLEAYLKSHTKGAESDEAWQVILEEYGEERDYYSLFAEIGCVGPDNLDGILTDIGEDYPEMKAYFLRTLTGGQTQEDFFDSLAL
jgi:hypothetical protein